MEVSWSKKSERDWGYCRRHKLQGWLGYGSLVKGSGTIADTMDLILGGDGAVVVNMGFLYREGGIEGDNSQNALKWLPSMDYSFHHFPYIPA